MAMLDMQELQRVMDEALSKDVEQKEEQLIDSSSIEYIASTDWEEMEEFPGVSNRKIDARVLFGNDKLPAIAINEYRGFTNTLPVPDIYIPHLESLATIIESEATGLKAIFVGDTGCGKTSILEYYAAVTGRPFYRNSWDETMDDQKLYGSLEIRSTDKGPETYFNPAITTQSMKYPAICVQDELSRGSSSQTMMLNPLLDRSCITITSHDGETSHTVKAHPDWLIFATDNTAGNGDDMDLYNSSNVLDQAIINRFDLYQRVPYAPASVEARLIAKFAGDAISEADTNKLAHFSELCHKGFSERTLTTAFSVRNLQAICKLIVLGHSVKTAIKRNYVSRVAKSEQTDINEMIRSIWG